MFGLIHEKELWLCVLAAVVLKVVTHFLYPSLEKARHKVIFIVISIILAISLQQYYARHKHEFITRAKQCSIWRKMYTFWETKGGKFQCPEQDFWDLETKFHIQFVLFDFLIAFVIDRFLFSVDRLASGISGSYERIIGGVDGSNWWNPMAWFRSVFFIHLIAPIVALTAMSIAFTIVWKVCLVLLEAVRSEPSISRKSIVTSRSNSNSNQQTQSSSLLTTVFNSLPKMDTTYFKSTFDTFPFPYNLVANGILTFVQLIWRLFGAFQNYIAQLVNGR